MKPNKPTKGTKSTNGIKYAKQMREYIFKKFRKRISLKYAARLV